MVPSTTLLDMASSSSSSSLVTDTDESPFATTTTTKFPVKLHQLLEAAENDSWLSSIISWVRDGRGFVIHNQAIFDRQVMPEVFPTMRAFSSFRRQLNLYGIKKSAIGAPYEHRLLSRGRGDLVVQLKRPSNKAMTTMLLQRQYRKQIGASAKDLPTNTSSLLSSDSLIKDQVNALVWPLGIMPPCSELQSSSSPSSLYDHDPSSCNKKTHGDDKIVKDYKNVEPPTPLLRENKILNSMLTTTLLLNNEKSSCPKAPALATSCSYFEQRQQQQQKEEIAFSVTTRMPTGTGYNFEPTSIPPTRRLPADLMSLPLTIVVGDDDLLDIDDIQQEIINTFSSSWRRPEEE